MGYTTEFEGNFQLDRPLFNSQVLYLLYKTDTTRTKTSHLDVYFLLRSGLSATSSPQTFKIQGRASLTTSLGAEAKLIAAPKSRSIV